MGTAEWIALGLVGVVGVGLYASRSEAAPVASGGASTPSGGTTPSLPGGETTPVLPGGGVAENPTASLLAEGTALALKAEAQPTAISDAELARMEQLAQVFAAPGPSQSSQLALRLAAASGRVHLAKTFPGANVPGGLPNVPGGGLPNVPGGGLPNVPGGLPIPNVPAGGVAPPAADAAGRPPRATLAQRAQAAIAQAQKDPDGVNLQEATLLGQQLVASGLTTEADALRTVLQRIVQRRQPQKMFGTL